MTSGFYSHLNIHQLNYAKVFPIPILTANSIFATRAFVKHSIKAKKKKITSHYSYINNFTTYNSLLTINYWEKNLTCKSEFMKKATADLYKK